MIATLVLIGALAGFGMFSLILEYHWRSHVPRRVRILVRTAYYGGSLILWLAVAMAFIVLV